MQAYSQALEVLRGTDGWDELNEGQQLRVSAPLASRATTKLSGSDSIPFLRSELNACPQHIKRAVQEMMELLRRRPCRISDISISLGIMPSIATCVLGKLQNSGIVKTTRVENDIFYETTS